MGSELKHTPAKWGTTYDKSEDDGYRQIIYDEATGQHIAYCAWSSVKTETGISTHREANANHIVKCVNNHEAMKNMLDELVELLDNVGCKIDPDDISEPNAPLSDTWMMDGFGTVLDAIQELTARAKELQDEAK